MEQEWTVLSLSDWAFRIGLQPSPLSAGNGVMLYQPGAKSPILAFYLPQEGDYIVEVGFNPANEQSRSLRALLQPQYDEIEVEEGSRKWPRIGIVQFSSELLDQIATWASKYIVPSGTPKPSPVPVALTRPERQRVVPAVVAEQITSKVSTGFTKTEGTFQKFADWKKTLLCQRLIEHPDGRALYLYRLTEDEFVDLEQLLRKWLKMLLPRFGLARVANLSGFAALFVLYGAEWWRRRYDGSGFSWEPILRDLGADPDEWSPGQRSEYVQRGLRDWRLKPRESGALRFLGAVAVQGGLPLRLLASARGGIGHLLSRVLQLAAGTQATQPDLQTWVESLASMLPKSYRQATIFTLLADLAWAVLKLKQDAGLTASSDAIAILDSKVKDWRDRFPLPVDDEHAQGMIEQLIRDAASVRIERRAIFLPVERLLEFNSDGGWTMRSSLALTESLQTDQLAKLFNIPSDELPRTAELSLIVDESCQTTSLRRMAGHNAYRVERKPWGQSGAEAFCEHVLRMKSPDGRVWSVTATKGAVLDNELPWVFVEEGASYLLARQGSGSIAATDALVAMPMDWQIAPQADSEATELAALSVPERQVFCVRGVVKAYSDDGTTFRLRTGHAGAADESFVWDGDRYWLDFVSPAIAFRGMPSLYRIDEEGARRKVDGQPGCSVVGAPGATQALGPVILRYPATGEIRQRSRVLLLPKSAALKVDPFDAVSGAVRLHGWGVSSARVVTPGIRQKLREIDGDKVLELGAEPGVPIPDLVDLEVYWSHTTTAAKLRVPFPAKGVRAFDCAGHKLADGALLAAQHLAGTRILVSGGQDNARITLQISIDRGRTVRKYRLLTLPDALSLEVRLQDYASDIQQLLSIDDSPDTWVKVVIRIHDAELFTLNLARYAAKLRREGDVVSLDERSLKNLDVEELAALPVLAIRLEQPGDEAVPLTACFSEGVATGSWRFSPELREPGSWLIYPDADALLPFRPTLWPVAGEVSEGSKLTVAIGIQQKTDRESAIDEVIAEMAVNFNDQTWTDVEQLASQIGHLPLATLDVWRRFAHSPQGMAALALRFGNLPAGVVERFAQELPFAWETVPFHVWHSAMEYLQKQCSNSFGDEAGATIFRSHLDARIKTLSSTNGALAFLLGIAGAAFLPDTKREVQLLRILGNQANEILFEGESSRLMALRRIHADDDWPTGFNTVLSTVNGKSHITDYLYLRDQGFQTGVINMPLLLAAQAVTNQTDYWFADAAGIHLLRSYRAFDPEWFDEAYNQTVAHCLADELLEEE